MKAKTTAAPRKPAPKHQRLKVALVPVLLLVLAYVVFAPTDEAATDNISTNDLSSPAPVASVANVVQASTDVGTPANRPADTSAWPEANFQLLAGSNPFASFAAETVDSTPQHFVSANAQTAVDAVDHLAGVASELERRPVNFVFRSTKQNVIMLGDEILEEGTHLSPSVRLHGIDDDAFVLKLHP